MPAKHLRSIVAKCSFARSVACRRRSFCSAAPPKGTYDGVIHIPSNENAMKKLGKTFVKDVVGSLYGKLVHVSAVAIGFIGAAGLSGLLISNDKEPKDTTGVIKFFRNGTAKGERWIQSFRGVSSAVSPMHKVLEKDVYILQAHVLILQALSKSGPFAAKPSVDNPAEFIWGPNGIYGRKRK